MKIAETIYGKRSVITGQTMLKAAIALCSLPSRQSEGLEMLQ